jgi:hypothetical protein
MILEIKMTRNTLKLKDLTSQLINDIEGYRTHSDCKTFVAFIYDPIKKIKNPDGIKNDLEKMSRKNYKVEVHINS